MKKLKAPRPPLSADEIFERGLKMADALDSRLARGEITERVYSEAMLDLAKWAHLQHRKIKAKKNKRKNLTTGGNSPR
jgi:hypothetical protein